MPEKPGNLSVTINVEKMPEVLWQLRREMATLLRRQASDELDPRVADRLVTVALTFEAGTWEV